MDQKRFHISIALALLALFLLVFIPYHIEHNTKKKENNDKISPLGLTKERKNGWL